LKAAENFCHPDSSPASRDGFK